jgi:polyphosphate kinase
MTEERTFRFEVPSLEALDRLASDPLPQADGGPVEADFFRDLCFDTPERDLERRGASVCLRIRSDGGAVLTVEVRERAGDPEARALRQVSEEVPGVDPADAFAGSSEPARLLRAIIDPSRLTPRLELETMRRTRPLDFPGGGRGALACDVVTVRAGENTGELHEVELRVPSGAPEVLVRELGETYGLCPAGGDRLARAQAVLDGRRPAPRAAARRPREVAVIAADGGEVALLREGSTLKVPVGEGHGEDACRTVLRGCFGGSRGRLRLLGSVPGSERRPELQVWLAENVRRNGESTEGISWMRLPRVLAMAGTPAVQDRRTLAALHVAARSDVAAQSTPGEETEPGRTAATVAVAPRAAGDRDEALPPGSLLNMELSTLAFNRRVLVLAEDPRTPLLERVRFVSIFGANLDEFFRVRVAGFKRQVTLGSTKRTIDGASPEEQLDAIRIRARQIGDRAYALLRRELRPALEAHGIRILHPDDLDEADREHLREYYRSRVHPLLTPLAVGRGYPFPHIRNLRPALAVTVRAPGDEEEQLTILELPGDNPRFVPLPGARGVVPLEDVICSHLGELFPGADVVSSHVFRVTRSAELHIPKDREVDDLLQLVEEQVEKRPFRPVVRLEVERSMPAEVRRRLLRELQREAQGEVVTLGEEDVYPVDGLIDLRALREIANLPLSTLHYPPLERRNPIDPARPVFDVLREGEVLVQFPFDSFEDTVERFLLEGAEDPDVASIELALYRTDRPSRIVEVLRHASERGKRVVALVELTARFDEQRNIDWARYLMAAGIHVIYGIPGRKIHAKVALVTRVEGDEVRRYAYIGTGNLNAATAGAYTDLGLLTTDPEICADADDLFNALSGSSGQPEFRRLLVAPYNMRQRFVEMINREAELARQGRGGHIRVKVNGLADREIIATLYRASRAGVRIELIVRGICSLRPGVPGLSENIRVYSILGRFLEHSRIYYFANGGNPEYYIGSADWRTRNLGQRVEAVTPIQDSTHRATLDRILEEQLSDPDAWELGSDGSYYRRPERAPHAANPEG